MAGIEKIYGSVEEYDELYEFLTYKNPDLLEFMEEIVHFDYEQDIWLWNNCTCKFVIDRLFEQYDGPPPLTPPEDGL